MNRTRIYDCIAFTGWVVIMLFYFLISRAGFFLSDDYTGMKTIVTMRDNLENIKELYFNWGGRLFSWFFSNIFIRILHDKLWLDITNTVFFASLSLLGGALILADVKQSRKPLFYPMVLAFTMLLWLLYPSPSATLFWPAGASCYLWPNTLTILFLYLFSTFRNRNLSIWWDLVLFVVALVSAANEIPCICICFGLFVYFIGHRGKMKRTEWFLVVGFVLGSIVCVLAPGNFSRAGGGESLSLTAMLENVFSPLRLVREVMKYKMFWLLMAEWAVYRVCAKEEARLWLRKNLFLLSVLAMGVTVSALLFSFYNDTGRYLVFSETFGMVLFLKMALEMYGTVGSKRMKWNWMALVGAMALLFVCCIYDASQALTETKRQHALNEANLAVIRETGGVVALDSHPVRHRLALGCDYPQWSWEDIAYKLGLDSVHVYPSYCLDKYWGEPLDSGAGTCVIVEKGMVVVRHPEGLYPNGVDCSIDYNRPKKWYRAWYDRLTNYQYTRTSEVSKGKPDFCYEGYCYYKIFMKSENCANITNIEVRPNRDGIE